jgi:hypothetical protein
MAAMAPSVAAGSHRARCGAALASCGRWPRVTLLGGLRALLAVAVAGQLGAMPSPTAARAELYSQQKTRFFNQRFLCICIHYLYLQLYPQLSLHLQPGVSMYIHPLLVSTVVHTSEPRSSCIYILNSVQDVSASKQRSDVCRTRQAGRPPCNRLPPPPAAAPPRKIWSNLKKFF